MCKTNSMAERLNANGIEHFQAGRLNAALEAFDLAITTEPSFANSWNNRGLLHRQAGRLNEALRDFETAVAQNPSNPKLLANRAAMKRQTGDLLGAEADYTAALASATPIDRRYWLLDRAGVRRDLGQLEAAMDDCTQAIQLDPTDAEGYELRGRIATDHEDYVRAHDDLTRALALCERSRMPVVLHARAAIAVARKRFPDAVQDYDRAIAIDPKYAMAYLSRGHACYHLHFSRRALMDYRTAAKLDMKLTLHELVRITRLHAVENADEAMANCRKHLQRQPADIIANLRLAITLWLVGRHEEMQSVLEQAKQLDPRLMTECDVLFQAVYAAGPL